MSNPIAITAAALDKTLTFLARFFLDTVSGDADAARHAARALLASYGARTDRELRLAALTIAFGFGALDALSQSVDDALSINQVLRLRGAANALNRSAMLNDAKLDKLHALPPDPVATDPAEAEFPVATAATDLLGYARSERETALLVAAVQDVQQPAPLSRQQRRLLERQAEAARRRRQEQLRLAERSERRAALRAEAAVAAPRSAGETPCSAGQTGESTEFIAQDIGITRALATSGATAPTA